MVAAGERTRMTGKIGRDPQASSLPHGGRAGQLPRCLLHSRTTGRNIVLFGAATVRTCAQILRQKAGLRLALSSDFRYASQAHHPAPGEGILFESLGAALLLGDPDQARALARAQSPVLRVAAERFVRAHGLMSHPESPRTKSALADTASAAWGLHATGTCSSPYTGRGVRVALLDTGLDFEHPDFAGRIVAAQSFIEGLSALDDNGHGTFCAGVACGPQHPAEGPRYGVASAADLLIAKVLDVKAGGMDGNILAGIDWAVRNQCAVVSMSLGSPVLLGDSYPEIYEHVASRALASGTLLVAPAGNESSRPDEIAPVEHPANCPSVVAVGAVDQALEVASFSNGGLNPGGDVDLVAPGIAIASAAPRPSLYQTASGTSMAAPYVAGIAALLAEAHPGARGAELRTLLLKSARALSAPARDTGAGLVQAPY